MAFTECHVGISEAAKLYLRRRLEILNITTVISATLSLPIVNIYFYYSV